VARQLVLDRRGRGLAACDRALGLVGHHEGQLEVDPCSDRLLGVVVALCFAFERGRDGGHRLGAQSAIGRAPTSTRARPGGGFHTFVARANHRVLDGEASGKRGTRQRRDTNVGVVREVERLSKRILRLDQRALCAGQVGGRLGVLTLGQRDVECGCRTGVEARLHTLEQLARSIGALLGDGARGDGERDLYVGDARRQCRKVFRLISLQTAIWSYTADEDECWFGHVSSRSHDGYRVGLARSSGRALLSQQR
jgi:hypothetical protein